MSEEIKTRVGDVTCPGTPGEEVLELGFGTQAVCFQDLWTPGPGGKVTFTTYLSQRAGNQGLSPIVLADKIKD